MVASRFMPVAPKCWRLEINFRQDAVSMLWSMNLPDGIQRQRTAVDELNCVVFLKRMMFSVLKFVASSMTAAYTYKLEARCMERYVYNIVQYVSNSGMLCNYFLKTMIWWQY
ncbi:uncharacterized protein [Primulina eburnea]|uniref:uncharacterized protein n=1 Tax=Primulina eburnea TaxID=1245227 RepID=UPI003C6C29B2